MNKSSGVLLIVELQLSLANGMISLKRKALLKRLSEPKQVSGQDSTKNAQFGNKNSTKAPQIVISKPENVALQDEMSLDNRSIIEPSMENLDQYGKQSRQFLQIPDEMSDEQSDSSEEDEDDFEDLLLNELKSMKSRVQKIYNEICQLRLRTQNIQNDLTEVRSMKKMTDNDISNHEYIQH